MVYNSEYTTAYPIKSCLNYINAHLVNFQTYISDFHVDKTTKSLRENSLPWVSKQKKGICLIFGKLLSLKKIFKNYIADI